MILLRTFFVCCFIALILPQPAAAAPVVPGYERLLEAEESPAFRGEILLGELNCLSCHTPSEAVDRRIATKKAPDLSNVGRRVTPQYIRRFLNDPHGVKPGSTMPDILHASEARSKEGAIDFLVHYLADLGGPIELENQSGSPAEIERGRELFHSVGCAACHPPEDFAGIETPLVPLGDLASKTTVDRLSEFLLDPLKIRQSGRMPSLRLTGKEARSIAVYLLRDQMDLDSAKVVEVPGVQYEYFEAESLEHLPNFDSLTPIHKGVIERFEIDLPEPRRDANFAVRYRAMIEIAEAGEYRFVTRSDDGSRLLIDGEVVADNDGIHAAEIRGGRIELSPGRYPIEVQYFDGGGEVELQVFWSGPGIEGRRGREIPGEVLFATAGSKPMIVSGAAPFEPDPQKVLMGRQMFSALRCVSCHEMGELRPMVPAKPLADLNLNSAIGCLGDSIRRGLPKYDLTQTQRNDLKAALSERPRLAEKSDDAAQVRRVLASMNCYACHERDGIGGPDDRRAEWFRTIGEIDLGEEGKMPPTLTRVGAKLRPEAFKKIVVDGELHVRHYMAARMPSFGEENVQPFLEAVARLDAYEDGDQEPEFSESQWKIGHRLVGLKGLSCVTCHRIAGQKAVGIQGIDLATVYQRVNPGWFRRFLLDPASFNQDTRMPVFWPEGQSAFADLAGGDARKQIEGIWAYLALEKSMPLPFGIAPEGDAGLELAPVEETITHRTFMEGVGPRTIVAGYPEKLNIAFDANVVRLAKAWRGRFWDASGVASGRTDRFLGPLGDEVLDIPGPAFAALDEPDQAWPAFDPMQRTHRNLGGQFKGYRLDETRSPAFRYRLGDIDIEEKPEPWAQPGGAVLIRHFRLSGSSDASRLYFLAARGKRIEETKSHVYSIDGERTVELVLPPSVQPLIRRQGETFELLTPLDVGSETIEFEQIIRW